MSLTSAGLIASAISFIMLISVAVLYVGPWMNRQSLAVALSLPLWIHAGRYIALQIFSAQRFGFVVSDNLAGQIAWGDVAGALIALLGLWLLHYRSAAARFTIWVLVVESVVDLGNATIGGIREGALETAFAVTWLNLNVYAPALWVGVGLLVWQLLTRRHEALLPTGASGIQQSAVGKLHAKSA